MPTTNKKVCDFCLEAKMDLADSLSRTKNKYFDIEIGYNDKFVIVYVIRSNRVYIADAALYDPEEVYRYMVAKRPKDTVKPPVMFNMYVNEFKPKKMGI